MNTLNLVKIAKENLCKGIKIPRFRNGKIVYPVFYSICYFRDIKLSILASKIDVSRSLPRRWINGQYYPNEVNIEKLENILKVTRQILFAEPLNIKVKFLSEEERKNYHFKRYKYVYYPIIYGLLFVYGHSVKSFADLHNINYREFCILIRKGYCVNKELIGKLEDIFGLKKEILLYKIY